MNLDLHWTSDPPQRSHLVNSSIVFGLFLCDFLPDCICSVQLPTKPQHVFSTEQSEQILLLLQFWHSRQPKHDRRAAGKRPGDSQSATGMNCRALTHRRPGRVSHLAPPPPRMRAIVLPVRTRARREKSECRSAGFSNTRWYSSNWKRRRKRRWRKEKTWGQEEVKQDSTSLGKLLLEKTLRGHERWRCLEIQLLMLSQSTVPLGGGPSSRWSSTNCFCARTALPSNMRSSWWMDTRFTETAECGVAHNSKNFPPVGEADVYFWWSSWFYVAGQWSDCEGYQRDECLLILPSGSLCDSLDVMMQCQPSENERQCVTL